MFIFENNWEIFLDFHLHMILSDRSVRKFNLVKNLDSVIASWLSSSSVYSPFSDSVGL